MGLFAAPLCPEQRGLPSVWVPWRADPSVPRSPVPGSPVRLCPSAPSLCPRARGACPPGPSSPGTRPPGPPHTRVVLPWAVACPPLTPRAARWEDPRWPFPGSAPAPCIWQSPGLLGQPGSDFWGGFFGLSITENWLTTAGSRGWDVVRAPRRELERGHQALSTRTRPRLSSSLALGPAGARAGATVGVTTEGAASPRTRDQSPFGDRDRGSASQSSAAGRWLQEQPRRRVPPPELHRGQRHPPAVGSSVSGGKARAPLLPGPTL